MLVKLTPVSFNEKTGPIPVSTSPAGTCPPACPWVEKGCYAATGPLAIHWGALTEAAGPAGTTYSWPAFLREIRRMVRGQLWRHNQAGDLPGQGDAIDGEALAALTAANKGRRGFTYTHKPLLGEAGLTAANRAAVAAANAGGFTVNLSADNDAHADALAALNIGPVAVVMEKGDFQNRKTPAGRSIVVCPAAKPGSDMTCQKCGLCAIGTRKAIIGLPAHGAAAKTVSGKVRAANLAIVG